MAKSSGSRKKPAKKKAAGKKAPAKKAPAGKKSAKKGASGGKEEKLTGTRLLDEFGEALLNVGTKAGQIGGWGLKKVEEYGKKGVAGAGRIGRLGAARAELEKEKFALSNAYEALGKDVATFWAKKPNAAIRPGTKEIAETLSAVRVILDRIAEIEKVMKTLRGE